jgi:NADH-quinone oxidoreductase subunit M
VALILTLLVPAVAGLWLLGAARTARAAQGNLIALVASIVTLVLTIAVAWLRPEVNAAWVPALGLRWHFSVDGITIPLVLLTSMLTVAVVLHSRGREPVRGAEGGRVGRGAEGGGSGRGGTSSTYYACLLLVEFAALATFLTRDAIGFFIAFELVLIPMWVLISRFGDGHATEAVRADAANRFVFFTVLGSTLMLLGILVLVTSSGTTDLTVLAANHGAGIAPGTQMLVAALLVTGLGIKVPLWPAHTWLPPAHTVAPTAGSVLLAAVLLKMGTYGIIRVALPTVPQGFGTVAPYLAVSGAVGILWGGLACLVERDLKRLVAYSSVAHMGFVALGLASGTQTGLQAALFANIAHGLLSALLFLVVGGLKERWGNADLDVARAALRETSPRMGYALVAGFAAALGLPGLVGFWGEFLAVSAAWSPAGGRPLVLFRVCAVLGVCGVALAAGYALRVLRLVWQGRPELTGSARSAAPVAPDIDVRGSRFDARNGGFSDTSVGEDARGREWGVIAVLVAAVITFGVMPRPLLSLTSPDTARIITGTAAGGSASATTVRSAR